jgi:nucleoside-diphosphate-sugar epimerase
MRPSALITGATGFVGGHFVRHMAGDGWSLRALVRPTSATALLDRLGVERVTGDLGSVDALRAGCSGADVVFHLAAVTGLREDTRFDQANVAGVRNLVRAALDAEPRPRRVVYLSSYAACGPSPDGRPRTLHDPPHPLTAYGRTKLQGEAELRPLREAGVETMILRAPAVYGPGDHALLPYFRLVRNGVAPTPGGPERLLHLIFAPDLAGALGRAATAPVGTFAVAEPVVHRWSEVVAAIGRAVGRRPLRLVIPPALVRLAAGTTERVARWAGRPAIFNREKAEEMLASGWVCDLSGSEALLAPEAATPLAEGVAQTADWYRSQGWL